jgi:regulator of replication initiation timing
MTYELEKELARLNTILTSRNTEIKHMLEMLVEAHRDVRCWLAKASTENSRLRHENEQLRRRCVNQK